MLSGFPELIHHRPHAVRGIEDEAQGQRKLLPVGELENRQRPALAAHDKVAALERREGSSAVSCHDREQLHQVDL